MIKFYGYKRCSTSRRAQKWLTDHHVKIDFQDLVEQPPKKEDLMGWLTQYQDRGLKYFFNTHGQDYRRLHLKDKVSTLSISEAAEMMSQNGKLIKRPLVVGNDQLTCGFNEDLYQNTWLQEQA
ncbi:arsenate reductase family protein [Lactobacillus bombicola]|uniref:Arsenate reductase family protein n=1 Tax=Lactobacillus bombicola TaxID=1505723 RepID=A0A396STL8_9LACO|nr:arsenate reductase family protein [Lactobacillus bombicola]RHW50987.1 arsenate reductase family protein [Lactobacillus bombicola]RHW52753.1 arsenate reductase family protein [Lactobacillus bombicola]RHW55324.1 arsenate reductase family protein [Lactobacillus bombicola]